MKTILITGAAGFIGYHLTKRIINKKFKFLLLDNLIRGKKDKLFKNLIKNKNVKFLNKDLTKPFEINEKKIDYVFHLSARLGVKNVISNPEKTFNENIKMLLNTINAVKKYNKKTKFVFFSTSEVYSPAIKEKIANFPLKEDTLLYISKKNSPRDSYYISKLLGEKIVEFSGLEYLILRPHNIYGPRMGFSHVIPELINKFKNKKNSKIGIFSPSHKRAFCFIEDALDQIINLTLNTKIKNQIFNIGNHKEEIKIFDLAKKLKNILKSKKKIFKNKNTQGSPSRRAPCMKKTQKIINKKKFINLNQGLKKYLDWHY